MAGSVNRVIIMGALGRDPEIRETKNGGKIANMAIATSERWTDKRSGERKERTEWHRVSCFNPHQVKVIEEHVSKGSVVHIIGEVRTRKWTGQDGVERYTTEVVLPQFGGELTLISSSKRQPDPQDGYEPRQATRTDARGNPQYSGGDLDDEIPF